MTPIQTGDVCRAVPIHPVRLHRWVEEGVISPLKASAGSGRYRLWRPDVIPVLRTLVAISDALGAGNGGSLRADILADIARHHREGRIELSGGITLAWPVSTEPRILA